MTTLSELEKMISASATGQLPPVDSWNPEHVGTINIVINSAGDWFYEGEKMQRIEVANLLASILKCESDGVYYLVSPVEKLKIEVNDAPFQIVSMCRHDTEQGPAFELETNLGERFLLNGDHALHWEGRDGQLRPYVRVRHNLMAKLSRPVYYELIEYAEETEDGGYTLQSAGKTFAMN